MPLALRLSTLEFHNQFFSLSQFSYSPYLTITPQSYSQDCDSSSEISREKKQGKNQVQAAGGTNSQGRANPRRKSAMSGSRKGFTRKSVHPAARQRSR